MVKSSLKINSVIISGGMHGNEMIGIRLINKWRKKITEVERKSFETTLLFGNPRAAKKKVRFIEKDLNRSFGKKSLEDALPHYPESKRAKKIKALVSSKIDDGLFIIDLHSTSADMGLCCVIATDDPLALRLASHLIAQNPHIRIYRWPPEKEQSSLISLAAGGIAIEVGPLNHGSFDSHLCAITESTVRHALDFIEKNNRGRLHHVDGQSLTVFEHSGIIAFPVDEKGNTTASLHPEMLKKNFSELREGDPLFVTGEGETIRYDGENTFPIFIGEDYAIKNGVAMFKANKVKLAIP